MTSLQDYCIPGHAGLAEIKTYAQKMQDAQVTKSLAFVIRFLESSISKLATHEITIF